MPGSKCNLVFVQISEISVFRLLNIISCSNLIDDEGITAEKWFFYTRVIRFLQPKDRGG